MLRRPFKSPLSSRHCLGWRCSVGDAAATAASAALQAAGTDPKWREDWQAETHNLPEWSNLQSVTRTDTVVRRERTEAVLSVSADSKWGMTSTVNNKFTQKKVANIGSAYRDAVRPPAHTAGFQYVQENIVFLVKRHKVSPGFCHLPSSHKEHLLCQALQHQKDHRAGALGVNAPVSSWLRKAVQ